MKNWLNKKINIIGVPFDMGASTMGARLGPEAIRIVGLEENLKELGYNVEDLGDLAIENGYEIERSKDNLNNFELVYNANDILYLAVNEIHEHKEFPLILGGDHSQVLGSVKALMNNYENPGVIYFDAHADINTEETSLTGNIHGMPIAFLMGKGNEKLSNLGNDLRLKAENIVYIGLRDVDPGEREIIENLGIKAYTMESIDKMGIEKVMEESIEYINTKADHIHVSFDVDCLDPKLAPGTGVKVPGGLNFREAKTALRMLAPMEKIRSIEFVEVNPLLDNQSETAEIATELIKTLFGKTQL